MDWNSVYFQIIKGLLWLAFLVLGGFVTYWIDKHVKNEELKTTLASLRELVRNSTLETYQIYVQEMKEKDIFDLKAQKTAISTCLMLIKDNMPDNVATWLKTNVVNVDKYLKHLIEAQIGELKNSGKKGG